MSQPMKFAPELRNTARSKVPEVTLAFWVLKIAATTLGRRAAIGFR